MEQIGAALWAQRFILHAEISPILGRRSVFFLVIQDYRIIPGILRDQAPRRIRLNRISWQKPSVLRKDSNSLTGGFSFALNMESWWTWWTHAVEAREKLVRS